jgi:outer membrane protein assembly factor BamB/predicted phosphodiesterase
MLVGLLLLVRLACPCWALDNFSFIHMSDTHIPYSTTAQVMREAKGFGPVEMAGYGVTAPAPSFVIVTGDLTEFGGGKGWWEQFTGVMGEVGLPFYCVAGNHDNTWDSCRPRLAGLYGKPYYAFDHGGVHFVGLDTASPQDPRPSIGREELVWLEEDLAKVQPDTPIILFYHHPPGGEDASPYDRYRLYDLLRGQNVLVHLVGHGHGVRAWQQEGFDLAMGGSTFGDNAGFAIVDVRDNVLRIAYRKSGEATAATPLLEMPIAGSQPYPKITVTSPRPSSVQAGSVRFEGRLEGAWDSAEVLLNDEKPFALSLADGAFTGEVPLWAELAGAHFYRVVIHGPNGATAWRAGDFVADTHPAVRVAWRTLLGGSTKSTPAVWGDQLLVGADDGCLYALGRADGAIRWKVQTGGDVLGAPIVLGERACVGSGDGKLYEVSASGEVTRAFTADGPVYSSPLATAEAIIVATSTGTVQAISRETFAEVWRCEAPEYAVEDTLVVAGGTVYCGAWDTYVYALDAQTGAVRWRSPASGTREGGARQYYSPADCGPVVCGNRLHVADRKYHLSVMDTATGELVSSRQEVSGVGLSEDGQSVYLRTTKAGLVKLDMGGNEVWTAEVPLGTIAAAPVEGGGIVYSVSTLGMTSAVEAATGKVLWSFRTLPGFYAMADAAAQDGVVYVAGMDGSVTAIAPR